MGYRLYSYTLNYDSAHLEYYVAQKKAENIEEIPNEITEKLKTLNIKNIDPREADIIMVLEDEETTPMRITIVARIEEICGKKKPEKQLLDEAVEKLVKEIKQYGNDTLKILNSFMETATKLYFKRLRPDIEIYIHQNEATRIAIVYKG